MQGRRDDRDSGGGGSGIPQPPLNLSTGREVSPPAHYALGGAPAGPPHAVNYAADSAGAELPRVTPGAVLQGAGPAVPTQVASAAFMNFQGAGLPSGAVAVGGLLAGAPAQPNIGAGPVRSTGLPAAPTPPQQQQQQQQAVHHQNAIQMGQATAAAAVAAQNGGGVPGSSSIGGGGPGGSVQGMQQVQQFQRLKVEDALSYLDQVKLKFGSQPQVYNDFLDIMKEFKSQTIDTPGVITRVSNLFQGNPELIVGFNTFLPPGYKIEVQADNHSISVLQPGQPSVSLSQLTQGGAAGGTGMHLGGLSGAASGGQGVMLGGLVGIPATAMESGGRAGPHHGYLGSSGLQGIHSGHHDAQAGASGGQPVEFNHAISYVNKIKNRFNGQPDVYKHFLEILHTYQKEQKQLKDSGIMPPGYRPLSEAEVYDQVAKLFDDQCDLLSEFGQFLPDASSSLNLSKTKTGEMLMERKPMGSNLGGGGQGSAFHSSKPVSGSVGSSGLPAKPSSHMRRPSISSPPPHKKMRGVGTLRDVSFAEASKHGTLEEFTLFDKVRKTFKNPEVYDNFLRFLSLYTDDVLSRQELCVVMQTYTARYPELASKLREFMGFKDAKSLIETTPKDRISELGMEIDFNSCKKLGMSYRAVPASQARGKSSGRSALCREVLNDTWVSFPTWSEDSTFVTSKKTPYEENIYRIEDERFELDMVIESNAETMKVLESVQRRVMKMSSEDAAKFRLDSNLGGTSEVIYKQALTRLYGDKAPEILEGIKKNPVMAVPVVLRRIKSKDEEWREAQKQFNKTWAEQGEKFHMKSLDYQGSNFKQSDVKMLRVKSLVNEAETALDERKAAEEGSSDGSNAVDRPHLTYKYRDAAVVLDALGLIIHHVRRQPNVQKEDKARIKEFLRYTLQDMLGLERQQLSDDEEDDDDDDDDNESGKGSPGDGERMSHPRAAKLDANKVSNRQLLQEQETGGAKADRVIPPAAKVDEEASDDMYSSDVYSLFFANNTWYALFRLHYMLCDRLHFIKQESEKQAKDEKKVKDGKPNTIAVALRLKSNATVEADQYYSHFLEMVRNLLDGGLEPAMFEDTLREHYGVHAYTVFTIDKVVQNIVRQLINFVSDDLCQSALAMFRHHRQTGAAGGPRPSRILRTQHEAGYQKTVEQLFADEHCFKIVTYRETGEMQITLLPSEGSDGGDDVREAEKFDEYVSQYVSDTPPPEGIQQKMKEKPAFLSRGVRVSKAKLSAAKAKLSKSSARPSAEVDEKEWDARDFAEGGSRFVESREKESDEQQDRSSSEVYIIPGTLKLSHKSGPGISLYRKDSLAKSWKVHKKVFLKKHTGFKKLAAKWRRKNVPEGQAEEIERWLRNGPPEIRKCETVVSRDNPLSKPPYRPINRYRVTSFPEDPILSAIRGVDDSDHSDQDEEMPYGSSSSMLSTSASKPMTGAAEGVGTSADPAGSFSGLTSTGIAADGMSSPTDALPAAVGGSVTNTIHDEAAL